MNVKIFFLLSLTSLIHTASNTPCGSGSHIVPVGHVNQSNPIKRNFCRTFKSAQNEIIKNLKIDESGLPLKKRNRKLEECMSDIENNGKDFKKNESEVQTIDSNPSIQETEKKVHNYKLIMKNFKKQVDKVSYLSIEIYYYVVNFVSTCINNIIVLYKLHDIEKIDLFDKNAIKDFNDLDTIISEKIKNIALALKSNQDSKDTEKFNEIFDTNMICCLRCKLDLTNDANNILVSYTELSSMLLKFSYEFKIIELLKIYKLLSLNLPEYKEAIMISIYSLADPIKSDGSPMFKKDRKNLFIEKMLIFAKVIQFNQHSFNQIFLKNILRYTQKTISILSTNDRTSKKLDEKLKRVYAVKELYKEIDDDIKERLFEKKFIMDLLRLRCSKKTEFFLDIINLPNRKNKICLKNALDNFDSLIELIK